MMSDTLPIVALLLALVVLAGCVRAQDEPPGYLVFLPAVAHDCTPIICGHVERINNLMACEQEMARLRVEEMRAQMADDCIEFRATMEPIE